LKLIRNQIKKNPIDAKLLALVQSKIKTNDSYRFRSSSNAEDLKGFNGAGLYDSYSGIKNDSIKTIERAIKKVWASVYNDAAYRERKLFNIQESSVSMAVLVHRGFPSEEANGVAVTKNLFREGYSGFTINAQIGEESVVAPRDTVICEQMVLIPEELFLGQGTQVFPLYITRSNLTNGKAVLTQEELEKLYYALEHIKFAYYSKIIALRYVEYERFGLDIEFKFDDGQLYIKQVRPFGN
jgi:pyruvate, water dikinase